MTADVTAPTAFDRMVSAINNPDAVFTRDQVAYMLGVFTRWVGDPEATDHAWHAGYQARVAEENADYPPPVYFRGADMARLVDQTDYRRQCDAAARLPREGDHGGGPVPVWEPDFCGEYDTHYRHGSMVVIEGDDGRPEEVHFKCRGVR